MQTTMNVILAAEALSTATEHLMADDALRARDAGDFIDTLAPVLMWVVVAIVGACVPWSWAQGFKRKARPR